MAASSDNPMRREHDRLGARYIVYGGAEVVADYGIDYHIDLPLANPLLVDLSFQGMLRVSGPDSGFFLHTVLTCDVGSLTHGHSSHALMLDGEGNVIDELLVICSGDDEYMLIVDAPVIDETFDWLKTIAAAVSARDGLFSEVQIGNESGALAMLAIMGPDRLSMLNELRTEPNAPDLSIQLGSGTCFTRSIGGIPMMLIADEPAETILVLCSREGAAALWQALLSFPELQAIGLRPYEQVMRDMGLWLDGLEEGRLLSVSESGLAHLLRETHDFVGASALLA